MSKELRICPGVGARKCGAFLARLDRDPHPTCTRCRGRVCTRDMTCDFCAVWSAEQWALFAKKRSYKERKHRPSGSAPPAQQTSPRAETSSGVSRPGTSSSRPLGGQGKQEGSQGAPGVVSGGAPSPPARPRSSERGGSASRHLSGVSGLASSSPSPSGGGGVEVARSRQTSHSRVSESVDSPSFSPHVPRRENVRESSGSCSRAVSSRDSRSSVREPRKDRRARSRDGSSRGRRRLSRSRSSSRSRSRGRERTRRSSSASRSSRGRSRRERSRSSDRYRSRSRRDRSRSSDRYRSRRDRSRRERSRSVDRSRSRRERARSPARRGERRDRLRSHASPSRSVDRSRSIERLPAPSARLREDGAGRLARRGAQEGVEAVASQPPVAPGGSVDVTPVAGGASMTALPSAMKELARFFLNLSGSSSLGASGDSAGVTASGAVLGGLAGPSSSASGAATICGTAATPAGAGVLPDASDALPSVSGEHRRRVRSRSRGRRSRSSSDGTDRRAKKRSRRRSPSLERSSRRREKRYRSSSESSGDERAAASSPRARRAHGGARAGGSTWDYGRPRSYARVDPDQPGTRRRSPGPSGVADDDRSTTFESVDFARDDSFRAVLGLIREFHDMAEPATVPGARCKTSLASAYGLAADSYPAFSLPLSPLLSTLLIDINSDLSKFMEDQTVHGFLPVPGRRQRRYYGTSTSSFPGPYTVPPGLTSITMEKASEVRKRSVSLSASQVSSLETMLSGMCEVASWLDWWLSTCGGYRDLLPVESRADFERLMMSGSRALEFLASQGCTALGNLVLSRRDALLADVRGTVPAEEVARLRYSPLPLSASIFPHALLDSALLKMRAAASDALVQRTLHPPRIPRKPAASGQASGSTTARSGQASTSGAAQTQKQSAPSSSSGQSGLGKKKGKGKAPFSSSSRGSGRSGGKGKGAGKKSACRGDSPHESWGLPVASLEEVAGNWSRDLGGDRSSGWLPCPVQGLSPPLARTPVSFPTYRAGSPRAQALRQEVEAMLAKGALEIARDPGPGFYSRLFLVEKATGGWRPVIDLSHLNDFVQLTPFKMETVASVLLSVREGDFLASLDLKDAYFQIPIHGSSRKLLRFMSEGTVYQFKALYFGLSTAPQVFTRVFAVVSAWAHARGIRLLRYLDDWLVLSSSEKKAKESIRELLSLCRTLGIVINEKKSDLVPSQSAKYLGMTIDTGAGKVFPSLARVEKFLTVAGRFCTMQSPPAQLWQVVLGHLASLERLVPHGRLRMRSLQWHLKSQWSPESDPPSLPVALPEEARRDLSWWMVRDHLLVGVRFGTPAPDLHLYSDASSSGWGAHLLDQNVSRVWSAQEKLLHINLLEMKALFLALQSFQEDVAGHHVTAMCDNSTVVAYINKQGGTVSRPLCLLTSRLLRWTESFDVHLEARYLPGESNVLADVLSRRGQVVGTEWSLHPQVARALLRAWGNPSIDLFATCLNAKLPLYCSLVPDPQAVFEDAFRHPWDDLDLYAFPPFALVGRVIARVQQSSRVAMTLVAPLWPEKEWFADLLLLLTQPPLVLPCWDRLLRQPHCNLFHQGAHALSLHAWRLSSDTTESRAFREGLLEFCQGSSENLPLACTSRDGRSSVVGVVEGALLQSMPLYL